MILILKIIPFLVLTSEYPCVIMIELEPQIKRAVESRKTVFISKPQNMIRMFVFAAFFILMSHYFDPLRRSAYILPMKAR